MAKHSEEIDNFILLKNGLEHIHIELNKTVPLFFRIGKEAHLVFYRTMTEALRGTANLTITGRHQDKKRVVKYKIGDGPWLQIKKIKVDGCKNAWRYSDPAQTQKPNDNGKPSDTSNVLNYLQSFYDLLAKIQAACFMSKYFGSNPIQVSDNEMLLIEWLHENIRNEFEHFIPKKYYVAIPNLISASAVCLSLSFKLFFESRNVILDSNRGILRSALEENIRLLKQRQLDYAGNTG
jgi:hypothetical protein